jgi:hypothetical protein
MMVSTQKSRSNVNFKHRHEHNERENGNGARAVRMELEVVVFFLLFYGFVVLQEAETECLGHPIDKLQLGV